MFKARFRGCSVLFNFGEGPPGPLALCLASLSGSSDGETGWVDPVGQFWGEKAGSLPLDSAPTQILHNLSDILDLGVKRYLTRLIKAQWSLFPREEEG
jgi:hypothetical protein